MERPNPKEHQQLKAPDAIMDSLTPTFMPSRRRATQDPSEIWKEELDSYITKNPEFLNRCQNCDLIPQDIGQISTALETAGSAGASLEVFSAKLRLLEREMVNLLKKYPELERSFRISIANKRGALTENLIRSSATNANAAKELLNNPELNKNLFDRDALADMEGNAQDLIVERLLAKGAAPADFSKVVYITGDNSDKNKLDDVMAQSGFVSAEDFVTVLDKRGV